MSAWDLPVLPLPKDISNVPYVLIFDNNNKYAVPSVQYFKNSSGLLVPVSSTDPLPTKIIYKQVADSGKKIDVTTTDRTISPSGGFNNILVINDTVTELRLCIDADSTLGVKIIYLSIGENINLEISGSVLHYSATSGTGTFRYTLLL